MNSKMNLALIMVLLVLGTMHIASYGTYDNLSFCKNGIVYTNQSGISVEVVDSSGVALACSNNEKEKWDFFRQKVCIRGYLFQMEHKKNRGKQVLSPEGHGLSCSGD